MEIKDLSLFSFYETILNSINIFQNQTRLYEINFIDIIGELVSNDLAIYSDETDVNETLNANELLKKNISIVEDKDILSKVTSYKLYIDSIENTNIEEFYLFNHNTDKFQQENIQELKDKLRGSAHYILLKEKKLFIYTPQKELLKCFDRINRRKDLYDKVHSQLKEGNTIPDIAAFQNLFPENKNYSYVKDVVLGFTNLPEIKEQLKSHYKNAYNILDRLTNWMSLFNQESIKDSVLEMYMQEKNIDLAFLYTTIMTVLNKHVYISNNHIEKFSDKIKEISSIEDSIILPIKNPLNDGNGLKRLLEKSGFHDRSFNWEKQFYSLCNNSTMIKKIIIITDIAVSGSQTVKAFQYYMSEHKNVETLIAFNNDKNGKSKSPKEERYFLFDKIEESITFKDKIKNCEEIIFVSSIMTEAYETKIKDFFRDINSNVSFEKFQHALKVDEYLYGDISYNKIQKDLFEVLVNDVDLISKLFKISEKEKEWYENSIKYFDKVNLILRTGSLPAKHIKLFSLQPYKGLALLDYINNW